MKKIDWVASSVILVTTVLLFVVIFIGDRVPVTVTCQSPVPCTQVSPFGFVVFEFSRPVQADQVEGLWQITPQLQLEGKWEWLDDQHARWNSLKPLSPDQKITLQFSPGQVGRNGERIGNMVQWEVMARSPLIIFTRNTGEGQELFISEVEGGSSGNQLTHSNGRVFDFKASPDGDKVVFSVINDQNGIDLWLIQRDGLDQRKFLDCGMDRCSSPAWSPITQEIAYTRESAGLDPNGPRGAPRIWILDEQSGQTAPLFTDPQKIGYGPEWSPDGQWLSIWNGAQGGIQVVNRQSGETFLLESANGDVGCWTPDSQILYFSNMVLGETGFHNVVLRADIKTRSISTIFGGNVEGGGSSYDNPVCSPTDPWVLVKFQSNVKIPGKELLLFHPDSMNGISISDDLSRLPSFYSWTPDGNHLVYQLDILGGKENDVEIWARDRKTGKAKKIITGGRSPQWLP